jgi:phosphomannomutase
MGPGPDLLNAETVARCAHGLVDAGLRALPGLRTRGLVIGRDARAQSDAFADVVAAVAAARGVPLHRLAGPVPTPLVSFAVRRTGASLGVMVTASHNPPVYNGLKVFGPGGAQIVPPFDAAVEAAIDRAPPTVPEHDGAFEVLDLESEYLDALARCRASAEPLDVRAVYSALHGVGYAPFRRLGERHGLELSPVVEQCEPDGRFPTVDSPNPEDASALDRALERARSESAELVLVHDPDADRLAVAVLHESEHIVLSGDQIGVLLADHLLGCDPGGSVVLSTVVSSRMIERLAAARGATSLRTPTGFKWMALQAAALGSERRVRLAYEQALGFSVEDVIRDKDGLGAGLAVAEVFATQRARGRTLVDRWAELEAELGAHRTESVTLAWAPGQEDRARAAFEAYRAGGPLRAPGSALPKRTDFRDDAADRGGAPPFDLVLERFGDGSWVGVRPSGTEPKLKVYIEGYAPPGPDAGARATDAAAALAAAVRARLAETP